MANTLKPYRQTELQERVEHWFGSMPESHKHDLKALFSDYISSRMANDGIEEVMAFEDFVRTLYSVGIVDITDGADRPIYQQLSDWRPSLDQVRRLRVPQL